MAKNKKMTTAQRKRSIAAYRANVSRGSNDGVFTRLAKKFGPSRAGEICIALEGYGNASFKAHVSRGTYDWALRGQSPRVMED